MYRDVLLLRLQDLRCNVPTALLAAPFDAGLRTLWDCCETPPQMCNYIDVLHGRAVLLTVVTNIAEVLHEGVRVPPDARATSKMTIDAARIVARLLDTGASAAELARACEAAEIAHALAATTFSMTTNLYAIGWALSVATAHSNESAIFAAAQAAQSAQAIRCHFNPVAPPRVP